MTRCALRAWIGPRFDFLALLISLVLVVPGRGLAHEFWLAPFHSASGDTIEIRAFTGTGFCGEPKTFDPERVVRFEVVPQGRLIQGSTNDLVFARLEVRNKTGATVAYQSNFAFIELPADRFDRYLKTEGLDGPLRARSELGKNAGPGRERYLRCCKTWIPGPSTATPHEPVGLTLEIVPLANPADATKLPFRVLYQQVPLEGALVRAWNRNSWNERCEPLSPVFEGRTNTQGIVTVPTEQPGTWLIATVHMVPGSSRQAEWDSFWSSWTHTRPGEPSKAPQQN